MTAAPLSAATFTVNSTAGTDDGACGPATGACTLREAIAAANATAGRQTIRFAAAVFTTGPIPIAIELGSALPVISDPAGTAIDGTGASVRIVAGAAIANGLVFASGASVILAKVTVANVAVQGFTNHGIHIGGGEPPECDADVSGALVRNVVAVNCGGAGIVVGDGSTRSRASSTR